MPKKASKPTVLIYDACPGFGGAITSIAALVPQLIDEGMQVVIVALQQDGWKEQGLDSLVQLIRPFNHGAINGVRYLVRETLRSIELYRIARRVGASLILANNGPGSNLGAYLAPPPFALPVAQYIRGAFYPSRLSYWALRRSKSIFTVSSQVTELCSGHKLDPAKIFEVPEGLSASQWPRPRQWNAKNWFWSSALAKWKGIHLLLEAYVRAGSLGAPPSLKVCYLPLDPKDVDADQLPSVVPPGVEFLPNPSSLNEIRSQATAYFHTALIPEPFGRSILEAMAAGLCPVVPDEGGGKQLVSHRETGIVYQARSASSLASAMCWVNKNPDKVLNLGQRAKEHVEKYRAEKTFGKVIHAIKQLAAKNRETNAQLV